MKKRTYSLSFAAAHAPDDSLGAVLARLADDHRQNTMMIDDIVQALSRHPARDVERLAAKDSELMQSFAANENRHIAIENAVVLAIARIRLSQADMKALSRSMKVRRGVAA